MAYARGFRHHSVLICYPQLSIIVGPVIDSWQFIWFRRSKDTTIDECVAVSYYFVVHAHPTGPMVSPSQGLKLLGRD
jgi:hypothetical protein